ncbi:MAG: hypothetical protein ACLFP8_08030 [Alphaproteobacteria bacterium]
MSGVWNYVDLNTHWSAFEPPVAAGLRQSFEEMWQTREGQQWIKQAASLDDDGRIEIRPGPDDIPRARSPASWSSTNGEVTRTSSQAMIYMPDQVSEYTNRVYPDENGRARASFIQHDVVHEVIHLANIAYERRDPNKMVDSSSDYGSFHPHEEARTIDAQSWYMQRYYAASPEDHDYRGSLIIDDKFNWDPNQIVSPNFNASGYPPGFLLSSVQEAPDLTGALATFEEYRGNDASLLSEAQQAGLPVTPDLIAMMDAPDAMAHPSMDIRSPGMG